MLNPGGGCQNSMSPISSSHHSSSVSKKLHYRRVTFQFGERRTIVEEVGFVGNEFVAQTNSARHQGHQSIIG